MKIAIFSGEIPSTTFIERLIRGVGAQHEIFLFGVVGKPVSYSSKNIKIYKTPYSHVQNFLISSYRLVLLIWKRPKDLRNLIKEVRTYRRLYDRWIWFSKFLPIILYKPDILHLQWARDLEFYAFLKTRFGIKLIVSLRGAHINYTPIVEPYVAEIYKRTFPLVDAFHAVSEAIAIEAQHYKADPSKIQVIHSPIPNEFFERFSVYKKQNRDSIKLVSVGRFHWKKGFSYAIDAISNLKTKGYTIVYTIIGEPKFTEALLFQIHQLELETKVILKDSMSQEHLIMEMKQHDLLILPSLEEGIANVVLEAMALGIPVISTDCGGMREVVIPNKTGWLVPVRHPKALAHAIVEVAQTSEQDIQGITHNAHDFVRQHFNTEASIQMFLELYRKVMMNDE